MQRNKSDAAERSLLTAEVAARLVGVSPRMIRKLADSGHIQRAGRGKYPFVSVTQGYIRYLEERRAAAVARAGPADDLAQAKAKELSLRIDKTEARSIEMQDAEAAARFIAKVFRQELASAFDDLPPDVARIASASAAVALAKYERDIAKRFADLRAGRDPLDDNLIAD